MTDFTEKALWTLREQGIPYDHLEKRTLRYRYLIVTNDLFAVTFADVFTLKAAIQEYRTDPWGIWFAFDLEKKRNVQIPPRNGERSIQQQIADALSECDGCCCDNDHERNLIALTVLEYFRVQRRRGPEHG